MATDQQCPACRHERLMANEYRREPPKADEDHGYGYAWVQGAAHVMALVLQGKVVALGLCADHRQELTEQVQDTTGAQCPPVVGHPFAVFKLDPSP